MIARLWHGATPISKGDEYLSLMQTVALPDYRKTPGNINAYVLRRDEGDVSHFTMLTFWDSIDAIKAFAGEDYEIAKYYPFDTDYLLELSPKAFHFQAFDR